MATVILAFCATAAALSSIWDVVGGGFLSGLVSHGFIAATIGGLADLFAVTAIFEKPLGIGWRTDILRRSRARIMGALRDFISDDLLSCENIMKTINEQDFSKMLVSYIEQRGGRERLWAVADILFSKAVHGFDIDAAAEAIASPVQASLARIDARPLVERAVDALNSDENRALVIGSLTPLVRPMLMDAPVQEVLLSHITTAREAYEGESAMRQMVFSVADLDDEKLLDILNGYIDNFLLGLENGEGAVYEKLDDGVRAHIASLAESPALIDAIEQMKRDKLSGVDIKSHVKKTLSDAIAREYSGWRDRLREKYDALVDDFIADASSHERFNAWIKKFFAKLIDEHHDVIPRTVDEYLGRMSDDEIISFAREKVDDDLQMIRINGSIVGAIVGMALYVVMFVVEGVSM